MRINHHGVGTCLLMRMLLRDVSVLLHSMFVFLVVSDGCFRFAFDFDEENGRICSTNVSVFLVASRTVISGSIVLWAVW